jgi:MFS family permease
LGPLELLLLPHDHRGRDRGRIHGDQLDHPGIRPARYRGRTDLIVNGSFWLGAALGAGGSLILLDPAILNPEIGWRLSFFLGAALGLVILFMRAWVPESPRWLVTHGRAAEAEAIVAGIEARGKEPPNPVGLPRIRLHARTHTPLREVFDALFRRHRLRAIVGLSLMGAQAFFYNAIFFTTRSS